VPGQLDLFGPAPAVGPAPVPSALAEVAARLPALVRLGTSSWSFPGWTGIVWDRLAKPARLARDGLRAYGRHPLLRAVGIDRTYYAPVDAATFAGWAAQVPRDFRFLVKAPAALTSLHAEGAPNPRFLDASWARDVVVGPAVEGLGERLGVILLQLPPQDARGLGGPAAFATRLHHFLTALPPGPVYAVELRNAELLTGGYGNMLADAGACHCYNVHPTMPDLRAQTRTVDPRRSRALVVRWMLARHLGYEAARARYQPFDRLADDDPTTRSAIAGLCLGAVARRQPALVIANNKAEGSAPLSVFRLAERIVESSPALLG